MNLTQNIMELRFLDEASFPSQVLGSESGVLVVFWVPWSKPCRVIDPVLLKVAQACAGTIEVVKVDADENPNLSLWFGVQHIPTLLFFQSGRLTGSLVGTVSEEAILKLLSPDSKAACGDASPKNGGAQ